MRQDMVSSSWSGVDGGWGGDGHPRFQCLFDDAWEPTRPPSAISTLWAGLERGGCRFVGARWSRGISARSIGVAAVRLSIVPFYLALIADAELVAGGRGAHRAADEPLDGLADRLDLHLRSAASSGALASLRVPFGGLESRLRRGEPGGGGPLSSTSDTR